MKRFRKGLAFKAHRLLSTERGGVGRVQAKVSGATPRPRVKREFFIDNLLVRIHFIIAMIRWTGDEKEVPSGGG